MEVKCTNIKCLHEWQYKGNAQDDKDLITCPKCHYRNMLGKAKINGEVKNEVSIPHEQPHEVTSQIKEKSNNKDYSIQENEHGDKAMIFNDSKIIVIPRAEILMKMLENYN